MRGFFLIIGVVLSPVSASLAQRAEPVPAPDDVSLHFQIEGDQHRFHLGELIPMKFSYTADNADKYIYVSLSNKLAGGRGLEVTCSPPVEAVKSQPAMSPDPDRFTKMLNALCTGSGVGGGIGSGCGDCDSEYLLKDMELSFGTIPLNRYLRFRTPGTYSCVASAADITMVSRDEKIRPALLLKSKPVVLSIIDDPAWAHSAATAYADAYDKICRGDDTPEHRTTLECFDTAVRITYLDTRESLAAEVRMFDGRNHGWENGFWDAVQHSSYPEDALRLMTHRIQDADVQVSTAVLESLAIWDLKINTDAFQNARPAIFHSTALDDLRKYVRLLGSSLPAKNRDVRLESIKSYRTYAEQEYCEGQPLIPTEERNQVLASVGIRP